MSGIATSGRTESPFVAPYVPTTSQRLAIEADPKSLIVLAGPGAGKTFCLTERIRFLIEHHRFEPARICAFTFTNKAAGEIAHRLETQLGDAAARVKRGTIHAFCAELLRELGASVLLEPGFGIADEEYQLSALRRIEGRTRRWHRTTLNHFSAHRFRGDVLEHEEQGLFEKYEHFLKIRKVVDFDTLVVKAAELLERPADGAAVRARWDVILVDEFQDLNPVQYRIVRALAREHHHVFAVGDDEQSIYSWAGADPRVFREFATDFRLGTEVHLEENRRCPHEIFALARKLIAFTPPLFTSRFPPRADRRSPFPIVVENFDTDEQEAAWVIGDINRDHAEHGYDWGEAAVLYRKHEIGEALEAAFLNAGIPCRLAQGRALADDPVVAYVIAALRVIARPKDALLRDAFFRVVLPKTLFDRARARAESKGRSVGEQLSIWAKGGNRKDEDARRMRRALADWRNLQALGKSHPSLAALIQDLLSRRVGAYRSVLEDRHDEISDPESLADVVALAARLRDARNRRARIWMPRMNGAEIALKGILTSIGFRTVTLAGDGPSPDAERILGDETPSVGIVLGVFKAAQLLEIEDVGDPFDSFTAIDLETTDNDTTKAEIVEIAAVRVRDAAIVDQFHSLVRPRVPIAPAASDAHGWRAEDVASSPFFEDVWPAFRDFCGEDVVVAHNGYDFDFKILQRMVRTLGCQPEGTGGFAGSPAGSAAPFDLCTYDTLPLARDLLQTSKKLEHLAPMFGIETGRSHRALDDTLALAKVTLALDGLKRLRARKTALANLLDFVGLGLALSPDATLTDEGRLLRQLLSVYALGRYSTCLEFYEREQGDDLTVPTVDEVIEALGGADRMVKVRADKTADERYPAAMLRLRRLVAEIHGASLDEEISLFLERALLSKWDGHEPDRARLNLLTLHSTKGLEFSRVYIVGVEDGQLPGGSPSKGARVDEIEEARRLLYVGMTRTKDRLVLTRAESRAGKPTGGAQFLDEMGLVSISS
jgi:superfamily I DNA/RNA helicase